MTKEQCKKLLPVIQAFANGEDIEYWDALQIVGTFQRGMWKKSENMGFGTVCSNYRMIKMGKIYYFDGRAPINDTLNKYVF